MRTMKTGRASDTRDRKQPYRTRSVLQFTGALLVILSAVSSHAQMVPAQMIDRNSSRPPTVSRNQLLAPGKAQRAIERARKEILGGHFDSAQKEIARALDIAPHFGVAKVLQGAIDVEIENYQAARTLFQGAIDDDPALGAAYVGMAVVLIHDGRFQTALPLLDRAEGLLPEAWFVHFAKAWAQLEIGNPEAAIKQADFAERLAGTDAERRSAVSYVRAMVSIHLKDIATARVRLVEAVERDRGGKYATLASKQLESLQPLSIATR